MMLEFPAVVHAQEVSSKENVQCDKMTRWAQDNSSMAHPKTFRQPQMELGLNSHHNVVMILQFTSFRLLSGRFTVL